MTFVDLESFYPLHLFLTEQPLDLIFLSMLIAQPKPVEFLVQIMTLVLLTKNVRTLLLNLSHVLLQCLMEPIQQLFASDCLDHTSPVWGNPGSIYKFPQLIPY